MNFNRVLLIGYMTRDPELNYNPDGLAICNFSVATNWISGGKQETEYHNVVAFAKTAEHVQQYMGKGSLIMVEGHLKTSSWEKEGEKRYRTQIIAERVQFGPRRLDEDEPESDEDIPF